MFCLKREAVIKGETPRAVPPKLCVIYGLFAKYCKRNLADCWMPKPWSYPANTTTHTYKLGLSRALPFLSAHCEVLRRLKPNPLWVAFRREDLGGN